MFNDSINYTSSLIAFSHLHEYSARSDNKELYLGTAGGGGGELAIAGFHMTSLEFKQQNY